VILAKAREMFPDETKALELCKYVISKMTPLFCEAVTTGEIGAGAVLSEGRGGMSDVLHSLLVYSDYRSSDRFRLETEARGTHEWLELARSINEAMPARAAKNISSVEKSAAQTSEPASHSERNLERDNLRAKLEDAINDIARWLQTHPPGEQRASALHLDENLRTLLTSATFRNESVVSHAMRDSLPIVKAAMKFFGGRFPWPGLQSFAEWIGASIYSEKIEAAATSWREIEIAFLSDERVQISCGGRERKTYNYSELGFEDRRNGKPNSAWVMLREMANLNGNIPRPPAGRGRAMIQKRIEEIRERLRNHFGITVDPISFNGSNYQVSFKLGCRPSSET
jgi:hypothetical protein